MSRQRPDPSEVRGHGPLFDPPVHRVVGGTDPLTSRKAVGAVLATGAAHSDLNYLNELIVRFPGRTMAEHGEQAAFERGGDAFHWRLKLGRRTGTLVDAGAAHQSGERDGMGRWWPGRRQA